MSAPLLEIQGLVKTFGSTRALDGLNLTLERGACGLLGPNGAGKTTLIKLLLGLLEPDAGFARIVGHDPRRAKDRLALRSRVGYMPESDCLAPGMSAVQLVSLLGELSGLPHDDAMTRTHEVLDYVGLDESRYRPSEEYSTGMKQRLKLAQALVHDPPFLLLDEPTNGLDPKGRRHMLELVHDLGAVQGKSLLVCSHLLPDIERTCEHVIVLSKGRVTRQERIEDWLHRGGKRIRIRFEGAAEALEQALRSLTIEVEAREGQDWLLRVPLEMTDFDALFLAAAAAGVTLRTLRPSKESLEQAFLQELGA
jgi:ABC-2 type transport system ATP-binding protein